ncbi:hypothetical protein FA13DRAFT_1776931 [Coprinellus micaceus]|uniref:Phytanoyl-CoA dioxygenase n=1 Tax=Coprinellus micaceus TaxID=71717 RepID=A0A4Y7SXM2_COPMI|nr:hypothetical protein FA13DRAFT_1776931 [Coprinellus micaceus]
MSSPPLSYSYDTNGFVIIPSDTPLSLVPPTQLIPFRDACERVITKTRTGEWTRRRTVGKQFPPYDNDNPDSWGVQHLMHPDLGEALFAEWYCSERVLSVVKALLGCEETDLEMELFNLLINPLSHDFALRWHRDDVRETASEEEEVDALGKWHTGVQWNTALYRDECLFVVPGSHIVPRTPEQRALSSTLDPPTNPLDMPGAIQVILQPGDTVFYNSNILHCATYSSQAKRATLHACMGDAVRGGAVRARNILQHDLKWMQDEAFRETLPNDTARGTLDRLKRLQSEQGGAQVVYSLAG